MIRFINLKDQICECIDSFAFYDTINDSIIDFGGEQVFDDIEEFKAAYELEMSQQPSLGDCWRLERFINLIPNDYIRRELMHIKKAKKLIAKFYEIMPVNDSKFTSNESTELTMQMEFVAAKQAAIIAVEEILGNITEKEWWDVVLFELKKEIGRS